jgi:hypothetical protein
MTIQQYQQEAAALYDVQAKQAKATLGCKELCLSPNTNHQLVLKFKTLVENDGWGGFFRIFFFAPTAWFVQVPPFSSSLDLSIHTKDKAV